MDMTKTALLLVDIQEGLDHPNFYGEERNNPEAEQNAGKLLQVFREKGWPAYHVKHNSTNVESPLHPSNSGNKIKGVVAPLSSEPVYTKNVNSAFIGTSLESDLKRAGITTLIIVGLTTEHCISTTTRMSANLGFTTILVSDATAAFNKESLEGKQFSAQDVFDISIANLKEEFATVISTSALITQLQNH